MYFYSVLHIFKFFHNIKIIKLIFYALKIYITLAITYLSINY